MSGALAGSEMEIPDVVSSLCHLVFAKPPPERYVHIAGVAESDSVDPPAEQMPANRATVSPRRFNGHIILGAEPTIAGRYPVEPGRRTQKTLQSPGRSMAEKRTAGLFIDRSVSVVQFVS